MTLPRRSWAPPEYRRLGMQSGIMTASALAAYAAGLSRYGPGPRAGTLAFLTLTSAQLLHGWSARAETRGAALPPNPAMNYGLLAGFGLLVASQLFPGPVLAAGHRPDRRFRRTDLRRRRARQLRGQ